MEFLSSKFIYHFFLVFLLGSCLVRGRDSHGKSPLVRDDSGFGYDDNSTSGPSHWGKIKPEWRLCSTGKMQSPIDIQPFKALSGLRFGRLNTKYNSSEAILVNKGSVIALEWDDSGHISIDGIKYYLKECHWHSPSEHHINGRRFDLEIHLVHKSLRGNLSVVGMVYEIGLLPDPFLCKLESYIEELSTDGMVDKERDIGGVDPESINLGNQGYYRYKGSLTTPPCTENVIWTVMAKVGSVSRKQVELIRNALIHEPKRNNARPVQRSNHRLIELYL